MKRATYLIPVLIMSIAVLMTSCSQEATQPQPPTQAGGPAPTPKPFVPPADAVPQTVEQLKTILANVKKWKAAGHNYPDLNKNVAMSEGLLPREMITENGPMHLFGGPADISAAPPNTGIPNTFVVLYSGVPNDDCVKLTFPAPENFVVFAGEYLKTATSEQQAKSLCTTGNIWFVAK